jgi:hypothetical protein
VKIGWVAGWHALRYSEGRAEAAAISPPSQLQQHARVHLKFQWSPSCVPPGARPFPILRPGHQPATHRVRMDVLDCRAQSRDARNGSDRILRPVARIDALAVSLPAPPPAQATQARCSLSSGSLSAPQAPLRLLENQPSAPPPPKRCQDPFAAQNLGGSLMELLSRKRVLTPFRSTFPARFVESFAEPLARSVATQERELMKARESKLTGLAGLVVTDAAFFDVGFAGHGINDSHDGQDNPLSGLVQEVRSPTLRHALRITSGRATRPRAGRRLFLYLFTPLKRQPFRRGTGTMNRTPLSLRPRNESAATRVNKTSLRAEGRFTCSALV